MKRTSETLNVEVIQKKKKEIRLLKDVLLFISLFYQNQLLFYKRFVPLFITISTLLSLPFLASQKQRDIFSPNFMQNKLYIAEFALFIHIF